MENLYVSRIAAILREVNRLNPTRPLLVNPAMVEIVSPSLFSANGGQTNTRATLRAKPGAVDVQYFSGETYIYYTRRSLSRVFSGLTVPKRNLDYETSYDVIAALSAHYGIPIGIEDIGLVLTTDPEAIMLVARNDSLGYFGNVTIPYAIQPDDEEYDQEDEEIPGGGDGEDPTDSV